MSAQGGFLVNKYNHPYHGPIAIEFYDGNRIEYSDDYELLVAFKGSSFTGDNYGKVTEVEAVLNSLPTKKVTKIRIPYSSANEFQHAILGSQMHVIQILRNLDKEDAQNENKIKRQILSEALKEQKPKIENIDQERAIDLE
jgi:hypothetical protein